MSRKPGCTDSKGCLKPDSNWKPAKPPMFLKEWYLWVEEKVPG